MSQVAQDNSANAGIAQRFVYPVLKGAGRTVLFGLTGAAFLVAGVVQNVPTPDVASVVDVFTKAGDEFTTREGKTYTLKLGVPDADGCQMLTLREKNTFFPISTRQPMAGNICPVRQDAPRTGGVVTAPRAGG